MGYPTLKLDLDETANCRWGRADRIGRGDSAGLGGDLGLRQTQLRKPFRWMLVDVTRVGFDQGAQTSFVQLDAHSGGRTLQIAIGDDEARAITLELRGVKTERPLSNELLSRIIARTGNSVDRVEVTELRDETYYAMIQLDHGRYAIDSRPSDAIALALKVGAPIYVADSLMRPIAVTANEVPAPPTVTNLGITVQPLSPDLALYFGVKPGSGVVVADLGPAAEGVGLKRGDIVTAAEGRPMRSPSDFSRVELRSGTPIQLTVLSGTAIRTVTLEAPPPAR